MAKKQKQFRPKARRPRGFEDKSADILRAERRLVASAFEVYDAHGFEPLETPSFEYADALGKFLPDDDRPNEGVFSLTDDDDQWMSLRYDLTAPLARFMAENFQDLAKPFRRYQAGTVWRNEKPGPGRFREFVQCDADSVSAPGPAADAEMIMLAADVMAAAGLETGEYVIRVNNRKLLDGVLETAGVPGSDEGRVQRLKVLRAIDKLDRLGEEGVIALLGEGREDESGDYTEGAKLDAAGIKAVMAFTTASAADRGETLDALVKAVGTSKRGLEGVDELKVIDALLDRLGYGPDRAAFDTSVVRGLGYYTGPVFEAELSAEITDEKGRLVRIGSVGGGGRYDDLVARFTGQAVPATGFSFGVSRFAAALSRMGRLGGGAAQAPVVVTVMDKDRLPDYFAMAEELRAAGIRAEVFIGGGNMGKQLKYADKRGAPIAVIMGSNEAEQGIVQIKDLALGAKLSQQIEDNKKWREDQPAQFEVPREQLVTAIKERL